MIRDEEMIRDKLKFYYSKKLECHLSLEKVFYNGMVLELLEDSVVFNDEKIGETLIFFSEITRVEGRVHL